MRVRYKSAKAVLQQITCAYIIFVVQSQEGLGKQRDVWDAGDEMTKRGALSNNPNNWWLIGELIRQGQLFWRLFTDDRVALWTKIIPPATLIYLFVPIDLLPDVFLGWGQLDDIGVILLGLKTFIELCPPDIVREHLMALSQPKPTSSAGHQTIDTAYRVLEDEDNVD